MRAKSIKVKTAAAIASELDQVCSPEFRPTLAIVFVPEVAYVPAICQLLSNREIAVFGASAFGQFIDKNYDNEAITIMLLDIDTRYCRIALRETATSSTKEISASIAKEGLQVFSNPSFVVASGGIMTDGEMILKGIQEVAGTDVQVFGGLAASALTVMDTFVFTNDAITHDGIVAIILDDDKVNLRGYAAGGSQPLGIYHTITSSNGNIVYTIDDQPALDVIMRYCRMSADELKAANTLLSVASYFQIQLQREDGSPIMRTPMHANFEDSSLVFAGSLPQGAKVKFSILPGFEVVDNVVAEFDEFSKTSVAADALILFSCQGREIAFGPYMSNEIERLQKIWNVPMIGLFSFGELGRGAEGKSDFYNMTCSMAMLKEKES